MKTRLFLGLSFLAVLAVSSTKGKVFERCELARMLKKHTFSGFVGRKVADWVCLAKHESNYNTRAINDNGSSRDYGLFQINSKYWCEDHKTPGSKNICHINCSKFLDDDITDDMKCAKLIAKRAKGLTPWVGWKKHCRKNVDKYVKGCFKSSNPGSNWV